MFYYRYLYNIYIVIWSVPVGINLDVIEYFKKSLATISMGIIGLPILIIDIILSPIEIITAIIYYKIYQKEIGRR